MEILAALMAPAPDMQITLHIDGQNHGPYPLEQVREMLAAGKLKPTDYAFHDGLTNWVPLAQIAGVNAPPPIPAGGPPPLPAASVAAAPVRDTRHDFEYRVECRPDFAFVTVQIPAQQTLKVEASAMATMDTNLKMKTKVRGGLSRFITGESIFINEFTAENGPGEIGIAPGSPGDVEHVYLDGDVIYLQNSAFLAAGLGVNVESKWQGLVKGFFSGESLFLIRCSGKGDLWFNTYGAMIEVNVTGGYVVDTGHIVAFTDGLQYEVGRIGGYKSLFFSGEGLVCRFSGQGKVWIQTRQVPAFANWVWPYRPAKSNDCAPARP